MWREIAPYAGASTSRMTTLSGISLVRGLAESAVLVLVARVALTVADDRARVAFSLGPLGEHGAPVSTVLWIGLGLSLVMLCLPLAIAAVTARMAADSLQRARERLARGFLDASWSLQADERQGHLQEVMTTYVQRVSTGAAQFAALAVAVVNLGALLATAVVIDVRAALTILLAAVVLGVALLPLHRLTRRRSKDNRNRNAAFATQVSEVVGVAQEVKTFDVGDAVFGRMRDAARATAGTTFRLRFISVLVTGLHQGAAAMVLIAGLAVVYVTGVGESAALVPVVLLLIRSLAYGQQVQSAFNALSELAPYVRGVRSQEALYVRARSRSGRRPVPGLETLALRDVSFTYDGHVDALRDVSATISHGDTIGLVGPSGSGKSTLVQILLRLRDPEGGEYLINDAPAREYVLDQWYRRLAIVPQSPKVIEATVADNVRFFREGLTDEQVEAAVRAAHLHDEVAALPDGYGTVLRGIGGMLSVGQAQRLCLARALVGDPVLIFLDEPTSALDIRSETLVQQTLTELKGSVTLVIIAHRISTLRLCDRIMVLDHGRVQAFDTPAKVLESDSFYRQAMELSRG